MAVKRETKEIFRYAVPFATWIVLQTALSATAWAYAVRTALTALVGVCCWRFATGETPVVPVAGHARRSGETPLPPGEGRACRSGETPLPPGEGRACCNLAAGLLVGVLVTVLWIVPESSSFYRTWFCWPLGSLPPAPSAPSPYDPAVCGWALTIAKLVGSAFVIAPVEEVFFRSFLYRWLQNHDFRAVPLSRFNLSAFLWTIFLFTLEHDRPLAAALAGALYGFAAIRFRLTGAITAHVTTNLLLALHVIFSHSWAFW